MAQILLSAALFPFNWTSNLIFSFFRGTEKDERYCQSLEGIISCQQQSMNELAYNQQNATNEIQKLSDQVTNLSQELRRERNVRQQQTLFNRHKHISNEEFTLRIIVDKYQEEMQIQMAHQKSEYDELHRSYQHMCKKFETELKAEKEINVTLSQQLEAQVKSHANTVSEYKEVIQKMMFEQNAFRQKPMQEIKLLQQEATEREKALSKDLEDLKIQLHEQTTKNLELVAQFKAEEVVSQVVPTEAVQIMDELKDQDCQTEPLHMADEQFTQRIMLEKQLLEMQREMAHQKRESQKELKKRTVLFNNLQKSYYFVYKKYNKCETELEEEQQINVTLSQQLETQVKSHTNTVSEYEKLINNVMFEQDAFHRKLMQEAKLLQQEATKREKCLSKDLEDLKIQLHEQTTKNLELVAQFKAEEVVSQVVPTEAVQIMDELKDQDCQQEEPPAVSHDHELVAEDVVCEKAAEKKAGFWKRTRHFLGLRKKNKSRRVDEST